MSTKSKSFNYLISETVTCDPRKLMAEIATFFVKQQKKVLVLMSPAAKVTTAEAIENFKTLTSNEHRNIKFMYCKDYEVVLRKLLEIDSDPFIPNVVIIQSLHNWYTVKTSISKVPSIYASICSASVDLTFTLSKITKQKSFSFCITDTDEFPTAISEILYGENVIRAGPNCLRDVFMAHKTML